MRCRLPTCAALAAALAVAAPAAALAAPANDNYLASTTIAGANGGLPREFHDTADTSDATTQTDLFNPDRDGAPLGGAGPENLRCGATSFGRTVWWDFAPPTAGGAEIQASGFDAVLTVYRWNPRTSKITRTVVCQNDSAGPSEDLLLPGLRRGARYTVQVGGVGGVGGPLDFQFMFFPDRDGDGILDEQPDKCPTQPGIEQFGGCPPELRVNPSINYDRVGGGIRVTRLVVDRVPRGARVEARCVRCHFSERRRARHSGRVTMRRFAGHVARAGAAIEIRVTKSRSGRGRYRYGATGSYFRWPVKADGLGTRVQRCLKPGSRKPRRCL